MGRPEPTSPEAKIELISTSPGGANEVYLHVEKMPQFPGGDKALMEYLSQNLKYPVTAVENGTQGTVMLRYIVDAMGKINNMEVIRSLDPACDKEAIRVINAMPTWIPGQQNGKAVSVYYSLPIRFKMQADESKKGE